MIVDTDVFIWYFRGKDRAAEMLNSIEKIKLSAVTYMELLQGMRDKTELNRFRQELTEQHWEIKTISPEITSRAMTFLEEYSLSHSMAMADGLIAATAIHYGECLVTANTKHYQFLPDLELITFKP